jgi:hypothetical protein
MLAGRNSVMKPERPTIVLVFAILNLVFGGMGIIGFVFGAIIAALVFAVLSSGPGALPSLVFRRG